jgi:hypothetical protein
MVFQFVHGSRKPSQDEGRSPDGTEIVAGEMGGVPVLVFSTEGRADPIEVERALNVVLTQSLDDARALTKEQLRVAARVVVEDYALVMPAQTHVDRHWDAILTRHYDFDAPRQLLAALDRVTAKSYAAFIASHLVPGAPLLRRIAIHDWAPEVPVDTAHHRYVLEQPYAGTDTGILSMRGDLRELIVEDAGDAAASLHPSLTILPRRHERR